MDGIRAYWNGKEMWSRNMKRINCPNWFTKDLPEIKLDGELWMGRKKFENLLGLLNSLLNMKEDKKWEEVQYMVFDIPGSKKTFENRMEQLKSVPFPYHVKMVEMIQSNGNDHMMEVLQDIMKKGGEGLMLMKPGSSYINERTDSILKVKVN